MVAEKNFGGDRVDSTLKVVDGWLPVRMVTASRGKLVHHVGVYDELEVEP